MRFGVFATTPGRGRWSEDGMLWRNDLITAFDRETLDAWITSNSEWLDGNAD